MLATRLTLLVLLAISACSTPIARPEPGHAVSPLFYECIQTDCIYNAPGTRANAEEAGVKQEYFDQCVGVAQALRGSPEHAVEMDECMAKFGYFRPAEDSSY